MMQVAVRVDSSRVIGSGHLMRCLSLAEALRAAGHSVRFLCRDGLEGAFLPVLRRAQFDIVLIPPGSGRSDGKLAHSPWLPASQAEDADQSIAVLERLERVDWLIVDHYALDAEWESSVTKVVPRLLAIDDIADRVHAVDILLDQNVADPSRYEGRVPRQAKLLLGPRYALLRPEFYHVRQGLPALRPAVRSVLIAFGGSDTKGLTLRALRATATAGVGADVVVGMGQSDLPAIRAECAAYGFRLHVQTDAMAELMSAADAAIGACGSMTWERCCVGLPALGIVMAANQAPIALEAARAGALVVVGDCKDASEERMAQALRTLAADSSLRQKMRQAGMALCDGLGAERVTVAMEGLM